jgi:uncharacterized membrane protein
MSKARLEAFIGPVLAIAIIITVLELRPVAWDSRVRTVELGCSKCRVEVWRHVS